MYKRRFLLMFVLGLFLASCGEQDSVSPSSTEITGTTTAGAEVRSTDTEPQPDLGSVEPVEPGEALSLQIVSLEHPGEEWAFDDSQKVLGHHGNSGFSGACNTPASENEMSLLLETRIRNEGDEPIILDPNGLSLRFHDPTGLELDTSRALLMSNSKFAPPERPSFLPPGQVETFWVCVSDVFAANVSASDMGTIEISGSLNGTDLPIWRIGLPGDIESNRFLPSVPDPSLELGDPIEFIPDPLDHATGAQPLAVVTLDSVEVFHTSTYHPFREVGPGIRLSATTENRGNVEINGCEMPLTLWAGTVSGHTLMQTTYYDFSFADCPIAPGQSHSYVVEYVVNLPSADNEVTGLDLSTVMLLVETARPSCEYLDCAIYDGGYDWMVLEPQTPAYP